MRICALVVLLAGMPLSGTEPSRSEKSINYINMYVRLAEERGCGLHKLTPAERNRLNQIFQAITQRLDDNLRNSALAYLRNQGWHELTITALEKRTLDPARGELTYVIAGDLVLEPMAISTLMPGTYLARLDSGQCRVIDAQGRAVAFRVMP
jgi:hypothetical protein